MMTERLYAGQTLADRQAGRRKKLIDAGLHLFGTVGRKETSVRAVCRESGLTDRYFYEQFESLEDLLIAVLERCSDLLQAAILAGLEGGPEDDLKELARRGLDAFLATAEQDPRIARVAWIEALGVSPKVDVEYRRLNDKFASLLLVLASEHVGGDPSTPRNELLASTTTGGIKETVVRWILDDFRPSRDQLVEYLTDYLLALSNVIEPFDQQQPGHENS